MHLSRRLLVAVPLLIAGLVIGGWMFRLQASQELWGSRPLWFFVTLWAGIVALTLGRKYEDNPRRWRWLGLSTLTGFLLWLGFPTMPFTFLMLVAFVPLLMVERAIAHSETRKKGRAVFWYSYHAFVVWNILSTWWVANAALTAGAFAIWANSLFMAAVFWLYYKSRQVFKGWLVPFSLIVIWISFEYLHMRWDLTWPWLTLGNSLAQYPAVAQWYEYTGVFGGSLYILLANVLVFTLWMRLRSGQKPLLLSVQLGVWVLVPLLFSLYRYFTYQPQGDPKEVVVVQPNFEPHFQKGNLPQAQQLQLFLDLSRRELTDRTDYLIFPETVFYRINNANMGKTGVTKDLREFAGQYPRLKLVTGLSTYALLPKPDKLTRSIRVYPQQSDTLYLEAYNTAVQFENGEEEHPLYFKSKLVPGAEIFPFYDYLFFLKFIVEDVGGTIHGNGIQEEREAFMSKDGFGIGPVICYESVFGEYSTGYIKKGANALFIMTNDGWWDNTVGHRQHLKIGALRAIETRRSIARSANMGISAFINQRGDILQPQAYGEATAIRRTILFNDAITFYVRWGDLIGRVSLFAAILMLLNLFVKTVIRRSGDQEFKSSRE